MTALARPRLAKAFLPLGLLLSGGCNHDNTSDTGIIVEVSTDLRVPQDMNEVQLTASDPQGNSLYDYTYLLGNGAKQVMPPFRVGLYPLRDTTTPIHVNAVGQLDGQFVASRSATLSFIQGKKVVLPLPLLAVCKGIACKDGSLTCQADGKCASDTVDSKTLPRYVPNQPVPATDAATMIPDAQMPSVPMDAAVDTTADRAPDFAIDVAGGRDAFFATGGAGGTDGPSEMGGAIGTGGGTGAVDARTQEGDTPGVDTPPDVPVGGSGGSGGTTAMGGITASGGTTTAGGATGVGGTGGSGEAGVPDAPGAQPDVPVGGTVCGDGIVVPPEQCDDRNTVAGDGCSPTCRVETGYTCSGSPSVCIPTICGDGKIEGTEGCDDGNTMPFDGCSENCQLEPNCSGTACISTCGDGIVVPPEQCDDGNVADGDGCSRNCMVEQGFNCTQPTLGDKMLVPVIYRDFRFHNPPDFEAGVVGQSTAFTGIVQGTLDSDGKPVYSGIGGNAHVASADTFSEWYRDVSGVNHSSPTKMTFWNNGQNAYVNRYGPSGEQWNMTETAYYCGNVGGELSDGNGNPIPCTSKYGNGTDDCSKKVAAGETMLKCYTNNGSYSATFIVSKVDGNPLFFPVDGDTFTPTSELTAAQVPPYYDPTGTWPFDLDAAGNRRLHNFSFTTEVRYWFLYDKTKSYTLDFIGDDDVWVFINKRLAVDLGGIHSPVEGSITLDAATAAGLGLVDGNIYEVALFQTERQTTGSSFKLTLMGFNSAPSACAPACGDGGTLGGAVACQGSSDH